MPSLGKEWERAAEGSEASKEKQKFSQRRNQQQMPPIHRIKARTADKFLPEGG
jgi:hypothetical protein